MGTPENTSFPGLLCRMFWMLVGPLTLVVIAYQIATEGEGWLTGLDIGYFVILGGTMLARWVEFRSGRALTAEGEPATAEDLRRYLIGLGAVGFGVWVAVNLLSTTLFA